jgi:hypothetical protein
MQRDMLNMGDFERLGSNALSFQEHHQQAADGPAVGRLQQRS